jgi:hypothetical protein
MKRPLLLVFASALALTAGITGCKKSGEGTEAVAVQGTEIGIDKAAMDTSVKPGDDFYNYANGAWMRSAEIPADRSSIGSHLIADQQTEKNLNELISDLQKSEPAAGSDAAGSRIITTLSSTRRRSTASAWRRSRPICSASQRSRTRPSSPAPSATASAPTSIP